jgi:alpha-glucosidase
MPANTPWKYRVIFRNSFLCLFHAHTSSSGGFAMKLCIIFLFSIVTFTMTNLWGQPSVQSLRSESLGNVSEWNAGIDGITLRTEQGTMRLIAYSPSVVRVRVVRSGAAFDDFSYAVIAKPQAIAFTTKENAEYITLGTDALDIVVQKSPLRLKFLTKKGELLNEDEPAFGTAWQGTEVMAYKRLLPNERFIGLGEKTGGLDKRRNGYTNWNTDAYGYGGGSDPLYGTTPFYMGLHSVRAGANGTASQGLIYGIFFDNSYKSHFNFGASNDRFSSFGAENGEMNYYFIHRPSVAAVLEDYTALTGRMPLPPLWSLGYHQCRYSYFPESEVMNLAKTIRDKQIPADVLWFDIHYMDAYKVFTWHPERFPKPKAMLSKLDEMGFRNVVIIDPGVKVEKGYAAYEDGLKNDVFAKYPDGTNYTGEVWPGWCHFPDFTNPKTRAWWGEKYKPLLDDGLDGFWNDMNEPATWGQRFPDMVEFDFDGNKATHKRAHNVYGFQMARSTFEGVRKIAPAKRPFVLTRAFYSGIQRYSAVWTGDNTASDEHLLLGVNLVNNLGLAGIPFAGVDIGGFNGNGSRELFARWITVGAFTPFFRVHAAIYTKEQDPWSFGEDVEEISKTYIELRYKLLPYLYSTFYEATKTGMPVARSLVLTNTFDQTIYNDAYKQQYMFGQSLMIAPLVSNQQFAKVYLPEGEWYDLHTERKFAGKKEIIVEAPLERLPVFVKGGGLLLMQSLVQTTKQQPEDVLTVHCFAGKQGSDFVYYEDDGEGYAYEQGEFYKRTITFDAAKKTVRFEKPEGTSASKFKRIRLVLHGFDALPQYVSVAGKKAALTTDTTLFLKPLSGFDPLGAQGQGIERRSAKTTTFPNASEAFLVSW